MDYVQAAEMNPIEAVFNPMEIPMKNSLSVKNPVSLQISMMCNIPNSLHHLAPKIGVTS